MRDYRDKLTLEPWLLSKLAGEAAEGQEPLVELRECAILNVAAGILLSGTGAAPTCDEVQALALQLRSELLEMALQAERGPGTAASLPHAD